MLMLCLRLKKILRLHCSSFIVASSKQRSNLRKAISTDKTKLQKAIEKYCSVQEYLLPNERIEISEADIVTGEFPWSALTGTYDIICINLSVTVFPPLLFIKGKMT